MSENIEQILELAEKRMDRKFNNFVYRETGEYPSLTHTEVLAINRKSNQVVLRGLKRNNWATHALLKAIEQDHRHNSPAHCMLRQIENGVSLL